MRHVTFLAAAALGLAVNGSTWGQSLLKGLEERLQKGVAAVTQSAQPVPGTGYLGAVLDDDDQAKGGVRVKEVRSGAPADFGGLKAGDLITKIDDKAIARMDDLDAILNKAVPRQGLRFTVVRGGQQQVVNVMLGTRPAPAAQPSEPAPAEAPSAAPPLPPSPTLSNPADPAPLAPPSLTSPTTPGTTAPPASSPALSLPFLPGLPLPGTIRSRPLDSGAPPAEPAPAESRSSAPTPALTPPALGGAGGASLGIMVDELTDDARSTNGLTVRRGALITSVRPDSPAAQAGLPVGGLVVAFDGRRIDSADDLVSAIRSARAGQEVELGYYQGERFTRKTVRLGSSSASSTLPSASAPSPLRGGPLGLGRGPIGPDRPLLSKAERLIDSLAPKPASTVYNPSEMAALYDRVTKLAEQVHSLEERLEALENKTSSSPIPPPVP